MADPVPRRPPYAVNCSILLTELAPFDRPAAARAAGFDAVEFWWPFDTPTPVADEVDAFVASIHAAGVQLSALNFYAGDLTAGDRGVVSSPQRAPEFLANLDAITTIGERTGCRAFNALYGKRVEGVDPAEQDRIAGHSLARAAEAVARIGGTVLVEPLSGSATYPLTRAGDAVAVIDRVTADHGPDNLGLLFDVYHLAENGARVSDDIEAYAPRISHVQVADAPGRGQPGTGHQPIEEWIDALRTAGYDGPIGLEYRGDGDEDVFNWLPYERRGLRNHHDKSSGVQA